MTAGEPAPPALPEEEISLARAIAVRHVRTDRLASLFWAAIFGVGFVVLLVLVVGGSFSGHDPLVAAIVIGLLIAVPLYGTLSTARLETRLLQSLEGPPRQLSLTSERKGRSRTERRVDLHDETGVVATAHSRRSRILTSLSVPVVVLVFGEVAPGQQVVCVSPRLGAVATIMLRPGGETKRVAELG